MLCALTRPLAKAFGRFCPNQDMISYRTELSEEKKSELDRRSSHLIKRACQNQFFGASEFNWEADAWHDVFGLIRDDETFRMLCPLYLICTISMLRVKDADQQDRDKRPYEFIERDVNHNISVKRRIPDATMGLRSYTEYNLENGYPCDITD